MAVWSSRCCEFPPEVNKYIHIQTIMPTTPKNCLHWLSKHSQQREHFHAKRQMAHNSDTSAERFPGACIVSLHCVRKCSSSLIDESCKPCCVSCTSRSRKLVYPNSTSSRHSEKSSSRLCREFWAMSLSSSSMWTVSLQNAKRKVTIIAFYYMCIV